MQTNKRVVWSHIQRCWCNQGRERNPVDATASPLSEAGFSDGSLFSSFLKPHQKLNTS